MRSSPAEAMNLPVCHPLSATNDPVSSGAKRRRICFYPNRPQILRCAQNDTLLLLLLVRRLRLGVLASSQLAQRWIDARFRNHRLIVRILLQLLLVFLDQVGVLVAFSPLVIRGAAFRRVDIVLIGTLPTHRFLAARDATLPVRKHADGSAPGYRSPTWYFARIWRTLSSGIASAVWPL